ncbi:3-oxoacyl-ACP synthase [Providencia vermicola]|uniref:3-oxoacyl-ACP synthase n=2 Tax=Providencia TaxID=586 RepID=A0AAI9MYD4_PROST|nr:MULTISPECIES: 3-oxoacyl-ACP synthase [Providencia]ELR5046323.1 3-oxoacyl-ACP synthase [Providencia rettgeri]ELR5037315.1 3-oxoacyl-ACP synthase [Providencia stuartii]ELR5120361.1 3-oxoacyl-ACP synthase [Providencia stuartii]ELR5143273.1 3-oxoacyl-ACP synthase [Providencia stuartii]ELR5292037.1 3-oxoacyl-ACP synthase [Providencia stuartii]
MRNIPKNADTDPAAVQNIKRAIQARKYAYPAEISLLWKNTRDSSFNISWSSIMLTACLVSALLILLINYLL